MFPCLKMGELGGGASPRAQIRATARMRKLRGDPDQCRGGASSRLHLCREIWLFEAPLSFRAVSASADTARKQPW